MLFWETVQKVCVWCEETCLLSFHRLSSAELLLGMWRVDVDQSREKHTGHVVLFVCSWQDHRGVAAFALDVVGSKKEGPEACTARLPHSSQSLPAFCTSPVWGSRWNFAFT